MIHQSDNNNFKIFYFISNNTIHIVQNREINNLSNFHLTDVQYDFLRFSISDSLALCNIDTYNKILNQNYLNNETEYLFDDSSVKSFHRNITDKVFILEEMGNYRKIFTTILSFDNLISPLHLRLLEFLEVYIISSFTEEIIKKFKDLSTSLNVDINFEDLVFDLNDKTAIFENITLAVRNRTKEDLFKYDFKNDNNFNMFLPIKSTQDNDKAFVTDTITLYYNPNQYNFLQKLYPETTKQLNDLISNPIFQNEVTVQIPLSKSIKDMKFTFDKNIYRYRNFFINNILINFYRNPKMKTLRLIAIYYEDIFKLITSDNELKLLYVYGIDINLEKEVSSVDVNHLRLTTSPVNDNTRLVFKRIN